MKNKFLFLIFLTFCNFQLNAQFLKLIKQKETELIKLGEIRNHIKLDKYQSELNTKKQDKIITERFQLIRGAYDFKDLDNVLKKYNLIGIDFTEVKTYFELINEIKDEVLDYRIFLAFYNYTLAEGDRVPYSESVCLKKYFISRKFLQLAIKNLYNKNLFGGNLEECYEYIDFSTFECNNDYTEQVCNDNIPAGLRINILEKDFENLNLLKLNYVKSKRQSLSFYKTQLTILNKLQAFDTLTNYSNKIISAYTSLIQIDPLDWTEPYIKRADFKQYNLKLYSSAINDYLKGISLKKNKNYYKEYSKIADCYFNLKNYNNAILYYEKSNQIITSSVDSNNGIISGKYKNSDNLSIGNLQLNTENLNKEKSEIHFFLGICYYFINKKNIACSNITSAMDLGYDSAKCIELLNAVNCN